MESMNKKCEGIVLRQSEYRDSDMILSVLTKEYGKMSFLAKGLKKAKSKNASSTSLFTKSIFHFNENGKEGMKTLKMSERINMHHHIYEDLLTQSCAQIMCECMDKMILEDSEEMYEVLASSLSYLNEGKNPLVVLGLYLVKCNAYCGISANVDGCCKCHSQKNIASISLKDGGFLCTKCKDPLYHVHYSEKQLRNFRLFHKAGIDDIDILIKYVDCSFDDIKIIVSFLEEYSGIHLRSIAFLEKIMMM